ncbi:MAG TPA: hypothetical protein VMW34_14220 [Anaerolineales bacterium]|nr:hypothetical protein [Anaerolineales bacterium]
MPTFHTPPQNNRIGFHYYPDHDHYRESDLHTWLPELKTLGASWLTVKAPGNRAIPEFFITGLINHNIEPILHFQLPLEVSPPVRDLELLFTNYARWGVHYAILYDSPNHRASWSPTSWSQNDLVERFLDLFIPPAEAAAKSGLTPVFPPLTPGGDYWDTAFLRASLQAIERRGNYYLLDRLAISANAFAGNRPLNWGSGGPEHWPEARPYQTKGEGQDQRGFCIYDWYIAIAQAVLGEAHPIILLKLGSSSGEPKSETHDQSAHVRRTVAMAQALAGPASTPKNNPSLATVHHLPPEVLCGNFWLLCADPASRFADQAWFLPGSKGSPKAQALIRWHSSPEGKADPKTTPIQINHQPIPHYLILPAFEWGIADWHLNAARPFIRKYRPMIGFSLNYAFLAERVTVVGDDEQFPESALDQLRNAGCRVERISGDGTSIATQLADK